MKTIVSLYNLYFNITAEITYTSHLTVLLPWANSPLQSCLQVLAWNGLMLSAHTNACLPARTPPLQCYMDGVLDTVVLTCATHSVVQMGPHLSAAHFMDVICTSVKKSLFGADIPGRHSSGGGNIFSIPHTQTESPRHKVVPLELFFVERAWHSKTKVPFLRYL